MCSPACQRIHATVLDAIDSLQLPPGAKILDSPCGGGELCQALNLKGFETFGADIAPDWHSLPAATHERFRVADLNQPLPWPDATFAAITCIEGIEHLENPFAFVREAYRILAPDGYLVVTTPNITSLRSRVRYLGSAFYTQDPKPLDESRPHPLHHIGLRTYWEWRYILHTSGFRLVRVSHSRRKPIGFAYGFLAPWTALYTRLAMRKEKSPGQRQRNREILRDLTSPSLLFGDNLLLVARRPPRGTAS